MIQLAKRIEELEQTFNTKQAERQEHLSKAEECLTEMTKLQGAWSELTALKNEEDRKNPNVKVKDEGITDGK